MSALSGDLAVFHPVDVMQFLGFVRARGMLLLLRPSQRARVYFEDGRISGVRGSVERPRLGDLLLEAGIITSGDIDGALKRTEETGARLGEALIERGCIDLLQLENTLEDQLSRGLFQLLRWRDGSFEFRPGEVPERDRIEVKTSLDRLLFEGLKRLDEEEADTREAAQ